MKGAMNRAFKTVAVGGTFDELHKGHRVLLMKAFEFGDQILIGLCSEEFAKKLNKPHPIASYDQRLEDLKEFLQKNGLVERAKIIPLNDAYGPTLSKGCIEALVVSKETEPTATEINEKRKEMNLPPLRIIVVDMVSSDNHVAISTTRIRSGEIDREGHLLRKREND
jgi:pantetheine-phosphate adenylyltransferase